jgi:hypothetical protein
MYKLDWKTSAEKEFHYWQKHNRDTADKIKELLREMKIDLYKGTGNPKPLKYNMAGYSNSTLGCSTDHIERPPNNNMKLPGGAGTER